MLNAAMLAIKPFSNPHASVSRTTRFARGAVARFLVSSAFSPGTVPAGNPFSAAGRGSSQNWQRSMVS